MVEVCPKCNKTGFPYYSKSKGKSGQDYFNLYFRHIEQTGRKGQALQTTCYVRSVSESEYNYRPKKKGSIIESIETKPKSNKDAILEAIDYLDKELGSHAGVVIWKDKKYSKGKAGVIAILRDYFSIIDSIERS